MVLGAGLEEIRPAAFRACTSLERIEIPPAIKVIHDHALHSCCRLKKVAFCSKIEEFVTCEAMRGWWNQGIHENRVHQKTVRTYHFLFQCNIPERMGVVPLQSWQANVYEMLRCIQSKSIGDLNAHLDSIDSKLTLYKFLIEEASPLLELAIWKSRSTQRLVQDDDVILNIFSYL